MEGQDALESVGAVGTVASRTLAMRRGMAPKEMNPSRNASTATSFAAFMAIVCASLVSAACLARLRHG